MVRPNATPLKTIQPAWEWNPPAAILGAPAFPMRNRPAIRRTLQKYRTTTPPASSRKLCGNRRSLRKSSSHKTPNARSRAIPSRPEHSCEMRTPNRSVLRRLISVCMRIPGTSGVRMSRTSSNVRRVVGSHKDRKPTPAKHAARAPKIE